LKTLDNFIEKLKIEKDSVLLLTENSLTLLISIKETDETSEYNIDELFNIFLDKLIERLGSKGTLLIQTFDWRFCNGKKFDILNSMSKTSFLGNTALRRDDFIRTKHPIYSFAVTGKYKDELENLDNTSSFDINSPFNFIYIKKAKMIIIDITLQKSFTFAHFVEEMEQVDYRYNKDFVSVYIDTKGVESKRTYSMYVRNLNKKIVTYLEPLEDIFRENDTMNVYNIDDLVIRQIDLHKAYHIIEDDIRNNNAKSLYKIGES